MPRRVNHPIYGSSAGLRCSRKDRSRHFLNMYATFWKTPGCRLRNVLKLMIPRFCFILFVLVSTAASAAIKLGTPFLDNMVLQRGQSVPVWGWGKPDKEVTVTFAGQTITAVANAEGAFRLDLEPLEASAESRVFTVSQGRETLKLKNVLVGEVWICSGQSNMQWTLDASSKDAKEPKYQPVVEFIREEIKSANDPLLRYLSIPNRVSHLKPMKTVEGADLQWNPHVGDVSRWGPATAIFFGKELRTALDVPVGLIANPWGGRRVEAFMPMHTFAEDASLKAYYDPILAKYEAAAAAYDPNAEAAKHKEAIAQWRVKAEEAKAAGKKRLPKRPRPAPSPHEDSHFPATIFNGKVNPVIPYAMRGVIWYQGESNAGHYPDAYAHRFGTMIEAWRELWSQGDFPFYFC